MTITISEYRLPGKIISLVEKQVPTMICYDSEESDFVIGADARRMGLRGRTNAFNFKPTLWEKSPARIETPTLHEAKRPFWILTSEANGEKDIKTFNALEAAELFLRKLFDQITSKPEQIIVGFPAVREERLRENFRENMKLIFKKLGFASPPTFFPEPFAVFQYYVLIDQMFPRSEQSELILIIDIGGGTFNTCIIRTTEAGRLAKGGASSRPLGLRGDSCGGTKVDEALLEIIIKKATANGMVWKEDPRGRAEASEVPVLMLVEDAKIRLSEQLRGKALNEKLREVVTEIRLEKPSLHPENDIVVKLTGEDLKQVIQTLWRKTWAEALNMTLTEAEAKLQSKIHRIDKVIVAGGSSQLPFMGEFIKNFSPHLIDIDNIYFGKNVGEAVAYGIAAECREEARKDPRLKVDKMGTCILNDLYLGFRRHRRDRHEVPVLSRDRRSLKHGKLLSAPFETRDIEIEYQGKFPFNIDEDKLFYTISEEPIVNDHEPMPLNFGSDVCHIPGAGKILKKFRLTLHIEDDGTARISFHFKRKGAAAKKGEISVDCPAFKIKHLNIEEGESYIGIDFGTSNTYVTEFVTMPSPEEVAETYPDYAINPAMKVKLRELETNIKSWRSGGLFEGHNLIDYAEKQRLLMVFHSNKIEGSPLTEGETAHVVDRKTTKPLSEVELEARNLNEAYEWILAQPKAYLERPESFLRELNKTILKGLDKEGGEFRNRPVQISKMKFKPPEPNSVPSFMEALSAEIKEGPSERCAVEFAASMHAKFVSIHPFVDGNGRCGRLLMNCILLAYGLPVALVNFEDRGRYLDTLEEANQTGDISPFVEFIIECFLMSVKDLGGVEAEELISRTEMPVKTEAIETTQKPDPVEEVMSWIIQTEREAAQTTYDSCVKGFALLASEISSIVDEFNKKYSDSGYSMFFKDYDMISFEKYAALSKGQRASRTWFCLFGVARGVLTEKLLCFFQTASYELQKGFRGVGVSLSLARYHGEEYVRLIHEPITVREICYSDGQIIFLCGDSSIIQGNISHTIKKVVADVIENYMKTS